MAIFSPASIWRVRNAKQRAQAQPPRRRILYCCLIPGILFAALWAIAVPSVAQESTPEIVPLKKNQRAPKKDLGPRALALLKLTRSGSATLVPVMIEVNGKFYDAASYKADPVPMALESGTVYEGEKTGVSAGLFTVNSALHSLAANAEVPWLATGAWIAEGTKPKNEMKAEAVPRGIETSDAPPRLTKPTASSNSQAGTSPETPPASSPSASAGSPGASKPEEKTGEKKDDKASESKSSSGTGPAASTPPATTSAAAAASPPRTTSDDSYRPTLRRGRPTVPMPDFDVPGYAKPNSAKSSSQGSDGAKASTLISPSEPVELMTAISDAQGPELRSFGYEWEEGAQAERLKQMTELAKTQLRAYTAERAKGQIPATSAPRSTTARTTTPHATTIRKSAAKPAKLVEPIFENVQMHTFDLWGSNQPVLVLSVDAHLPPPATQSASEPVDLPSAPLQYKILLVTRTDIYGNLHMLYSGVTDRFHLDVIPQLDLIDAVDADGDGRGELLFHKTTDTANGYAIYRAASDTLWKMFDTVNPE